MISASSITTPSRYGKKYRTAVTGLSTPGQTRDDAEILHFAQDTARFFQHIPMVRVNIYNAEGQLLITAAAANDAKLANNATSADPQFVAANRKTPGKISNLIEALPLEGGGKMAVLQTLMPIWSDRAGLDATLEIIDDISLPSEKLINFQIYATGGVICIFLIFTGIVFTISRKTEIIIAKQHETNMELAAAAAAAEAENNEKSQFLANISHELRTPLNAIIGFSDIIRNEVIAPLENKKYHDYISDIHSSGVHLLSLINDILDYSKAEAGKLEMEVAEVNASKMIQNCMRLVSPRAESAQVALIEQLPKDPIIMLTDGKKFKQILLNLLSNAVKFTPPEGKVKISAWSNLAEDSYVFEVNDTGIGIAPKNISVAMSAFGQIDNSLKRKYEGTGLGLPLTKKFVELMGGKFTIESELNVGTTITFTLPRELKEREGIVLKREASAPE